MKRILALLLVLVMLLTLTACGKDKESTPTGESTGATTNTTESTNDTTDGTQDSTQGTTESTTGGDTTETTEPPTTTPPATTPPTTTPPTTTPPTTTPPTTTPPATDAPHTHSYSSKVTTAATCGKEGVKTFTCSCGDSYTEKIAATGQHSWGSWTLEAKAYVGKDGTEKRTCKTCSASETRKTTEEALYNSFWPYYGIDGMFGNGESSALNAERIQGYTLLEYIGYGYEGEERDGMDFEISSAGAFAFLDEHFVLTDAQKASMKEDSRYNATTDKFSLTWPGSNLNREIRGYTHNGGNKYTVYYAASNDGGEECNVYWKVVLEHNAPNGKPNRYISIVRVESIPTSITK